ncbi:MAG: hypothetical protein VW440_00205 [Bordetella sp.]
MAARWGLGWPSRGVLWAFAFAALYVLVFQINRLFDPVFSVIDEKISMVFLPAFVRVAAILVAGAAGALGLFLGALSLGLIQDLPTMANTTQAFFTALAPCLALFLLRFALAGRPLAITLGLFFLLALFASIFNSLLHHVFWDIYPHLLAQPVTMTTFWQMLEGDFAGALLGFGVFAIVVRLFALPTSNFTDADSGSTPE